MFDTGAQLRKVRKRANLTLDQLASLSGIDRGTISRIELGHVSPRIDTIDCLCQAMNTNLPHFFGHATGLPEIGEVLAGNGSGPQAGPVPTSHPEDAGAKVEADAYWPVPTSVWQSLVDVVERFEALLSNSGELVMVMDRQGRIIYLSPGGETILGYRRMEILGRSALDLVHEADRPRFQLAFAGPGPGAATSPVFRFQTKPGLWKKFECTLSDHLHSPSIRAVILNAALVD